LPVYRLLGCPSCNWFEVYGSTLGSSQGPAKVVARAKELFAPALRNQTWFLADGPGSGPDGCARNVKVAQILRETLTPSAGIMFDLFNGWDLSNALQ